MSLKEKLSNILNEYDKDTGRKEILSVKIADEFTRYLMGEKNISLSKLKDLESVFSKGDMSSSEYNALYKKTYLQFVNIIEKLWSK